MKEILVILGNGFDLALGMKTSYRNFYEQKEFWPFGKKENDTNIRIRHMTGLDSFLDKNMQENWYNLENLLADYATGIKNVTSEQVEHDILCFKKLKSSLSAFIDKEQRSLNRIYCANKAVRFLDAIFENRAPIIYTFNYTALDVISDMLEHKNISYNAVHGSICGKNIVLGIEDDLDIPIEYDFLKKVSKPTSRITFSMILLMLKKWFSLDTHWERTIIIFLGSFSRFILTSRILTRLINVR